MTEGDSVSLPVPPGLRGRTLPEQLRAHPSPPAVSAASGPRLEEVRDGVLPTKPWLGNTEKSQIRAGWFRAERGIKAGLGRERTTQV